MKLLSKILEKKSVPVTPAHGLIWFYAVWIGLAAMSAYTGHSSISIGSAVFIVGGIASTNFFFLIATPPERKSREYYQWLAIYQTLIALGWITAYFYFSQGAGDLVLAMYITVLMVAVFYLDTHILLRLCSAALACYLSVIPLKVLFVAPDATYTLADSVRFVILLAVIGWTYMFARQLRDLRFELHNRNKELQEVVDRVTRIAEEDHLTKSYNRRYIMDALARERGLADRSGKPFATLLFDLDHFKSINDRYGHLVGDEILADFARRVKAELRGMDTVNPTDKKRAFGRYGGEEFIAVLPETDLLGAHRCAERIRQLIAEQAFRGNYRVTVSVGVAEYQHGETVIELLARADKALYQAKRDGRNLVRCSQRVVEPKSDTVPKLRVLK